MNIWKTRGPLLLNELEEYFVVRLGVIERDITKSNKINSEKFISFLTIGDQVLRGQLVLALMEPNMLSTTTLINGLVAFG